MRPKAAIGPNCFSAGARAQRLADSAVSLIGRRLTMGCALFGLLAAIAAPAWADTLIHAGKVIDGRSDRPLERQTIVVKEGRIVRVVPGFLDPAEGDVVIDLSAQSILPGLMDMHTHLVADPAASLAEGFEMSPADYVLRAERNAQTTLMAGFTAVRDLGDNYSVTVPLRNAINRGEIVGPHIFTSTTPLSSTGGHGDPTNGLAEELRPEIAPRNGVVDSADDGRKAVRERYKAGADVIKVMATGGVMSLERDGQGPQLTAEELGAIVSTARDYGMKVASHAHGVEGVKRSVLAGVATIEHGTFMNDEIIGLMKARGTILVPTLMAGEWVTRAAAEGHLPPAIRPKAEQVGPQMAGNFARAWRAGVKIMFGTDSGVSPHGDNAREFELMVAAGMPPIDAIRSATIVPAEFLGNSDRYGTVEQGKMADLIAVPGDPLQNIGIMRKVDFVMLAGKVVKGPQ